MLLFFISTFFSWSLGTRTRSFVHSFVRRLLEPLHFCLTQDEIAKRTLMNARWIRAPTAESVSIWLQNLNAFAQSDTLEHCARYVMKSMLPFFASLVFFYLFFTLVGWLLFLYFFPLCSLRWSCLSRKSLRPMLKHWAMVEWRLPKFSIKMHGDNNLSCAGMKSGSSDQLRLSWTRWNQFNFENTIAIYFLDHLDVGCFALTLFVYLTQSAGNRNQKEIHACLLPCCSLSISVDFGFFSLSSFRCFFTSILLAHKIFLSRNHRRPVNDECTWNKVSGIEMASDLHFLTVLFLPCACFYYLLLPHRCFHLNVLAQKYHGPERLLTIRFVC